MSWVELEFWVTKRAHKLKEDQNVFLERRAHFLSLYNLTKFSPLIGGSEKFIILKYDGCRVFKCVRQDEHNIFYYVQHKENRAV